MNEKLEIDNDIDTEEYKVKEYNEFWKEIEGFGDLSKDIFLRKIGEEKRSEEEIKRNNAIRFHSVSDRFHNAGLTQDQVKKLEDFWGEIFYGSNQN